MAMRTTEFGMSKAYHLFNDFQRSRKRAIWLYNETLRRRKSKESFFKTCALENADKFRTHVSEHAFQFSTLRYSFQRFNMTSQLTMNAMFSLRRDIFNYKYGQKTLPRQMQNISLSPTHQLQTTPPTD